MHRNPYKETGASVTQTTSVNSSPDPDPTLQESITQDAPVMGLTLAEQLAEALQRISALQVQLDVIVPRGVAMPPVRISTHDFYLKTNIRKEWQERRKWVEIRRLQDLPPKFCKGSVVTLRGLGKVKVGDVFRVMGRRDLIALVGPELLGLGIPTEMDGRGHKARFDWLFTPKNTGLRLLDLTNHALVLFTVEFPTEYFMSDLNP